MAVLLAGLAEMLITVARHRPSTSSGPCRRTAARLRGFCGGGCDRGPTREASRPPHQAHPPGNPVPVGTIAPNSRANRTRTRPPRIRRRGSACTRRRNWPLAHRRSRSRLRARRCRTSRRKWSSRTISSPAAAAPGALSHAGTMVEKPVFQRIEAAPAEHRKRRGRPTGKRSRAPRSPPRPPPARSRAAGRSRSGGCWRRRRRRRPGRGRRDHPGSRAGAR